MPNWRILILSERIFRLDSKGPETVEGLFALGLDQFNAVLRP
jgi:hypothetical protein